MSKSVTPRKARDSTTAGRASPSTSPNGMTAREAVAQFCTHWTGFNYLDAWPSEKEPYPDVPEAVREEARRAASDELKAMLRLAFERDDEEAPTAPDQDKGHKIKPIRKGRLPKQKGQAGQSPIIDGLLDGKISRLRVGARGAWTLEPRKIEFAERLLGGGDPDRFVVLVDLDTVITERFILTRQDGAICCLKIDLKVKKDERDEPGFSVVYVKEELTPWPSVEDEGETVDPADLWTSAGSDKLARLAHAQAFIRRVDEVEHFAGPAPVCLRVKGRLGDSESRVWLDPDDLRSIEFYVEGNFADSDGRKILGLRFFDASVAPVQPADDADVAEPDAPRADARATTPAPEDRDGEPTPESNAANPDTPDEHETKQDEPDPQPDAEIDDAHDDVREAKRDAPDDTGEQESLPDQPPYPDAKQFLKVRPGKLLSEWLDPTGRSNQYNYRRISRMLNAWKDDPGDEFLFVKLGSRAAIVDRLGKAELNLPGRSQLRDFVTAWLYENAPDWYWIDA